MRNILIISLHFIACISVFVFYLWWLCYTWEQVMLQISQSRIILI